MKVLKTEFNRWNYFKFKQVKRNGMVAIYEQIRLDNNEIMGWEVVIIQYRREDKVLPSGGIIEKGEYYPTTAQWGNCGWTCGTLEAANKKMEELLEDPTI